MNKLNKSFKTTFHYISIPICKQANMVNHTVTIKVTYPEQINKYIASNYQLKICPFLLKDTFLFIFEFWSSDYQAGDSINIWFRTPDLNRPTHPAFHRNWLATLKAAPLIFADERLISDFICGLLTESCSDQIY